MTGPPKTIKLTKQSLSDLPMGLGRLPIDDRLINGLYVYSGTTKKSIYLRRRLKGQQNKRFFKVCDWSSGLSTEQIRKAANTIGSSIMVGSDPTLEKNAAKPDSVLLGVAFERLMETRVRGKNSIQKSTEEQYRYSYKTDLVKWANKPLTKITGDDVEKLHRERSKTSKSRANMAVRLIRMIYKYAMEVYRDEESNPIVTYNPADRITTFKLQNKIPRRTGHINKKQLKPWFEAVQGSCNEIVADLLIFTLLTGLRRNESSQLTWDRVDLVKNTFTIIENKSKRSVEVPLSDFLVDMLKRRKKGVGTGIYVFPAGLKSGYLKDWRKQCDKVIEASDVEFIPHDLRRTFITIAESLDVSPYAIKMLVNHALPADDVTGGYIQMDIERLRQPMQKITDIILKYAEIKKSAGGVDLSPTRLSAS